MIEKFDYLEPACPLCSGQEFYYPQEDAPLGRIPVTRVLEKADSLFGKNDYPGAGRLLVYWQKEALALKDKQGELAITNELIGFYRKQKDQEQGLAAVKRALELVQELEQAELASGATILINCATAYQAFGMAEEAMPLYEQAEQVYGTLLNADDARFGGLYNNMALALTDLGKYREAEVTYLTALAVMEQVSVGQAEAAITHINLAYLYAQAGQPEKISRCMDSAYELLRSEQIPRNGYYAFVLEKCAPAFRDFGREEIYALLKKESEEIYARS